MNLYSVFHGGVAAVFLIGSLGVSGDLCAEKKETSCFKQALKKLTIYKASGYSSAYVYRGLVASRSIFEGDTVVPTQLTLTYDCTEKNAAFLNLGYTTIGSTKRAFGFDTKHRPSNQFDVDFGWQNKSYEERLTSRVYWSLDHGGLPGLFAKIVEKRHHSLTQEFAWDLDYRLCDRWNLGITTSYSFCGMTGWWFQPYIQYQYDFSKWVGIVVKGGMSATADYFGSSKGSPNGDQAWYIRLDVPVNLHYKTWYLTPFVSFNWAGAGAVDANNQFIGYSRPYRNFSVVAGVSMSFTF